MEFLKKSRLFSFLYDGKEPDECNFRVSESEDGDTLTRVYEFEDGLKITNTARKIGEFGAYEWVNKLENTSDKPTGLITRLCDCDITLPLEHEEPKKYQAYLPDAATATKVYAPSGSMWKYDEFYCNVDEMICNNRQNHIYVGDTKEYTTDTGRSSDTRAPFFNIHKNGKGIIFAIGWTGKWRCILTRNADSIRIRTKVDDTEFRLYAGESVRTSSIVIMPYEATVTDSQNKWRRLVKEEFSLVGKKGRETHAPLCASIWGGMRSSSVIDRINMIKQNNLPFEYIWMDAGWYGEDTKPTPDEFEGDWPHHTGDWRVSKYIHPNSLEDVSKAIHDAGMKYVLWFEPERVRNADNIPIIKEHPEYLLKSDGDRWNLLLNLGNPEAWEYCFNTLSDLIERLGIDYYRQDFNFNPLGFWRQNDAPDRKGITEIKHIGGLYRLWDALLEKFPHLMIDNCASGGRRIDIETLRRSVPLWRSDAECPANYDVNLAQCQNLCFNTWLPYSGTGTGRLYDMYRVRSAYAAALTENYTFSERDNGIDTEEKVDFVRKFANEYLKVRPFLSEDFYPLTEMTDRTDVWCASQFDRPSEADGMIEIIRRENSPYPRAELRLGGIDDKADYIFTDADNGEVFEVSGKELAEKGFAVEMPKPRTAKLFFYTHKKESGM